MIALWFSIAVVSQAPAEAPPRCVVLPVSLPPRAATSLKEAAAAVELSVTSALQRYAAFDTLTRSDVMALLNAAVQEQLAGCSDDACLHEVADALGADYLVTTAMDRRGGLWNLEASLLDRRSAHAVRRAGVRARSLDALLASVEEVAKTLASVSRISVEDPNLAARLGTGPQQVVEVRKALAASEIPDLTDAWTSLIIARNGESEWLATLEGTAFLVAGLASLAGAVPFLLGNGVYGSLAGAGPSDGNTFPFPVVEGIVQLLIPVPFLVVAFASIAVGTVLGIVDALDIGRIPAARNGCCRDEARIRDVEEPGIGRRIAPWLAAGGALAALSVALAVVVSFPAGLLLANLAAGLDESAFRHMPRVNGATFYALYTFFSVGAFVAIFLMTVPFAGTAIAASLVLLGTSRNSVTDAASTVESAPVKSGPVPTNQ